MIDFDLHVHTIFSKCGIHTVLELINQGRALGMKGIAITDHGLTLGGRLNNPFFERFKSPFKDFDVLKGVECNIIDENGAIDTPDSFMPFIDVVLLGIHPNTQKKMDSSQYTEMLIKAIDKNPSIDIITHPNDPSYPVNYEEVARVARKNGVALELNNSKIMYKRSTVENTLKLVEACKSTGCTMAVCSDTHAIHELGDDSYVTPLLDKVGFPEELIVNRDTTTTLQFIESRKERKRA
ncbi:PHP domain-containing protein [Chitinispirillales bacterium ANBcel5]|uniref:PHP domain-containing protein n=1 Tax=Cellulosispirillum alkaliphilum TaxID=3039283 RepID=UPI002A59239B|nr:PHP domain-containing protein [Chitinispirillales bacterium ANBcel5]